MNDNSEIRVMSVMAHQDDFEFNAGGIFALLRKKYGEKLKIKILATTRGASGHHKMSLDETFKRRGEEAAKSAALIGAEYECLTCLDGSHLPGQVFIDRNTLGGLWNAIRNFSPHYIFCPPVITDPLAGIHIDHYNTAQAVRMTGYQLTVPHAYPVTGSEKGDGQTTYPVIINVDDVYAAEQDWHVTADITEVYEETKVNMALCHESQIFEWLPWNGGREVPSAAEFKEIFRQRHSMVNSRYGMEDNVPREFFRFTKWGKNPSEQDMETIFPGCQISEAGKAFLKGS
ncbi:MAG: PIG-L deacetylase family protein [Planctomycetota bacterium]